jgi:hypothetical protein
MKKKNKSVSHVIKPYVTVSSPIGEGKLLNAESDHTVSESLIWASVRPLRPISTQTEESSGQSETEQNTVIFGGGLEVIPRAKYSMGTVVIPGSQQSALAVNLQAARQVSLGREVRSNLIATMYEVERKQRLLRFWLHG